MNHFAFDPHDYWWVPLIPAVFFFKAMFQNLTAGIWLKTLIYGFVCSAFVYGALFMNSM